MKKTIITLLLLAISVQLFSQEKKFSVEANYPVPSGNNFIGAGYKGIVDIGLKYRFAELDLVNLGASLNGGYLTYDNKVFGVDAQFQTIGIEVDTYIIQPRIFAELNIPALNRLHPSVGLGYTFMIFNSSANRDNINLSEDDETYSGINANVGASFDILEYLFVQAQYDFVNLTVNNDAPAIKYNTKVSIFKIGFGFRF